METSLFDYNPEDNLLRRFEEIHDYIYANDGLSPQQTLNEFLKILFIKIYDEKEGLDMFKLSTDEFKELNEIKVLNDFTVLNTSLKKNLRTV